MSPYDAAVVDQSARRRSRGPTNGSRPVRSRSVVDLVIDEVRRTILDGSLAPGAPVVISELSAQLDVSHIPVREALRRLEGEGLIELRHGRSAVVAPLSADDLAQVFRLRALLEADVVARAVEHYTDEELDELEHTYDALAVVPGDDADSLSARHNDFHRLLVRPAATEWDWRLLDMLWQAGERYVFLILAEALAGPPTDLRSKHTDLLTAARSRSATGLHEAIRAHLAAGVALIGLQLGKVEPR